MEIHGIGFFLFAVMHFSFVSSLVGIPVTKILERGQKWNGVPILSCKIWHGQENNGMASMQDDERLWHSCDKLD